MLLQWPEKHLTRVAGTPIMVIIAHPLDSFRIIRPQSAACIKVGLVSENKENTIPSNIDIKLFFGRNLSKFPFPTGPVPLSRRRSLSMAATARATTPRYEQMLDGDVCCDQYLDPNEIMPTTTCESDTESTAEEPLICSDGSDGKDGENSQEQIMDVLFEIYCLLNTFFRWLLDSKQSLNCALGQEKVKDPCNEELSIVNIIQRIVDREILVDEKCAKFKEVVPLLTTINKYFHCAENLFCVSAEDGDKAGSVNQNAINEDILQCILDCVENVEGYIECVACLNKVEQEVAADIGEIICYLETPYT